MSFSICTLLKGVPHGPAVFECKDWYGNCFTGVGVFNHGQIHNTPFTCIGAGFNKTYSNMKNGKIDVDGYYT